MLVFEIIVLGLLTFFTVLTSGSKCPNKTLTRHVVCYYKGEVPLSNLTACDCTHFIFTNAITKNINYSLGISEGIKNDLALLKETKNDLITIFTFTVKEEESSAILKSKNKTQKVIDEISKILEETQFDGVELNFKFNISDGISKDSYTFFIKHLSKSITSQYRKVKREDELENNKDDIEPLPTTTEEELTTQTTYSTLFESSTPTMFPDLEENTEKLEEKDDFLKDLESTKNFHTITNSSKLNGNLKKFLLFIRLPIHLEVIGKKYDLKALTRYADILMVPTHYIFNEKESHLTYHPSRLMGLSDIFNTDSILDFLTGMGAQKSKIVISMPASVFKFQLKEETKNAPKSPAISGPVILNQAQLCSMLKKKNWTLERDEDLTAPYAFSQKIWVAFEDEVSIKIKSKYILLRELAGGAIYPIDDDINNKSCTNSFGEGGYLTGYLFNNFKSLERKPRALVLQNLQEEIHDNNAYSSIEAGVKLSEYRIIRVIDHSGAVHVIRKNTKTQFQCSRQGYFSHPLGCNKFYRCVKFDQYSDEFTVFEYNCPVGLAFDERWEVCVWPGSLPNGSPCTGSSEIAPVPRAHFQCPSQEGYYADPENCRWFFICLDHARDSITPLTAYEFRCPFGLVFNAEKLACDWPWLVGGCGVHAQNYIFGQSGGSSSASNMAVFINGGNLEGTLGYYGPVNQDNFLGKGFGNILRNIDRSNYGSKIQNSYQGSQSTAKGYIASPFDDNSKRGSFASFPDYEISGGRIFNKDAGVVLKENLNFEGKIKDLYSDSKLKSGYANYKSGVTIDNKSNDDAEKFSYFGLGNAGEIIRTGIGEKNLEKIYVNNEHLDNVDVKTNPINANRDTTFFAKISGYDQTHSNLANGYTPGQFLGQDIIANLEKSNTRYDKIGFSSEETTNKGLNLDSIVQYNIVKVGPNAHTSNNKNLPLHEQIPIGHNQATHFQELLPPFAKPMQHEQILVESTIPIQQPFSVNLKSVQINGEKHIDSNGPTVPTSVTPFQSSSSIFQSGSINSKAGDLSNVFGTQYSTLTSTPATHAIPITISQNKENIASSEIPFGFSKTRPANEINKIVETNTDYLKSISLNQNSVTSSPPIISTSFSLKPQEKSSKITTLSSTTVPISIVTPTYEEFSSASNENIYGNVPTASIVGFSSSDDSTNKIEKILGQKSFFPAKTSQIISNINENSNFEQFKKVSSKQGEVSYGFPPVTQSAIIQSDDSSLKNFGRFNFKDSNTENNKFSLEQQNFNLPSVVNVTPIPQLGQSGSSIFHFTKEIEATSEQKPIKFAFSTPKVELNLPVVTSTSRYEEFKPNGSVGTLNLISEKIPIESHEFGQNLEFNSQGNSNQQLLLPNLPSITSKVEFNVNHNNSQSGYISQPPTYFSNFPLLNHPFKNTPQLISSPRPLAYETISQIPKTNLFNQNKGKGFAAVIDNSKFLTQVSIEPQEIVSLGTITEKYQGNSFKSVTPNIVTPTHTQSNLGAPTSAQLKQIISSNSIPTIPVSTSTPYTLPGPILDPQQINAELLNTNVIISSTLPQSNTYIKQPLSVGFDQKIAQHKSSLPHHFKPLLSHATSSKAPIQNQPVFETTTPSVSFLGQKNDLSTTATPKTEIFTPTPDFENLKNYQQQSFKYFKDKEIFGQQNSQSLLFQDYQYTATESFPNNEYEIDKVKTTEPVHISSTLSPYENVKIQSLDSVKFVSDKDESLPNPKIVVLNPTFSSDSTKSFENSFSTTTKPVTVQESVKSTPKIYASNQFVKPLYESKESIVPVGHIQSSKILEGKTTYDLSKVSVYEKYPSTVEIQNEYLQRTPYTILKQQFFSEATETPASSNAPSVQTSINYVPQTKSAKLFNKYGAYAPSFEKLTESPIAFIEHKPNFSVVLQDSPKVILPLPIINEVPFREYVSSVTDDNITNQYFRNFQTQRNKTTNNGNLNLSKDVGDKNMFYKSYSNGLNYFDLTNNYGYTQETPISKVGQSIIDSNIGITPIPKKYISDENTFSNNYPELRNKEKLENQFLVQRTNEKINNFGVKILSQLPDTLLSSAEAREGHNDNINAFLENYSNSFGSVITDKKINNNYEKGNQGSSTFLYEISTNKPKERGRGRQYQGSSSSLPATNKYEEYDIDSQRSFNLGKDFSQFSKTNIEPNNVEKNKKNIIVVSQVSDANPILIGKLAGQCSCQSNQLKITSKNSKTNNAKRKNSESRQNDLYLPTSGENQESNIVVESVSQSDLSGITEITPETVLIGGATKYNNFKTPQNHPLDEIKSVTISSINNDLYLTSPSVLTSFPAAKVSPTNSILVEEKLKNRRKQFRGKTRYLPPTISYNYDNSKSASFSPALASDITLSEYKSKTQNEIFEGSSKTFSGAAYDRYGPGGWRGFDETLQGSVDCKRPGLFRHPKFCNKFYACNYDPWEEKFTLHVFNCPIRLTYDSSISACNWPIGGPACADDNLLV